MTISVKHCTGRGHAPSRAVLAGALLLAASLSPSIALPADPVDAAADGEAKSPATAQAAQSSAQAKAFFEKGEKRYQSDDLEGALEMFRRSYEIVPVPRTMFNIAMVEMDIGDARSEPYHYLDANRDFELYLGSPDPHCRLQAQTCTDEARTRQVEARKKLGHLVVNVEPKDATLTLDGQPSPADAWIIPSVKHVIRVEAPGQRVTKEVIVHPGVEHVEELNLTAPAPPPAEEPRAPEPERPSGPKVVIDPPRGPAASPPPNETPRAAGWVLTGAGNVLFGLGGIYGLQTIQTLEKHKQGGPNNLVDDARSSGDAATAICIGGAVLVGVGVTLLIASRTGKPLGALLKSSSLPAGVVW